MKILLKLGAIGLFLMLVGCSQPHSAASGSDEKPQAQASGDLVELISSGAVSLVQASGNGASSGNSIDAIFRNNTGRKIEVDVFLGKPLFLKNSGVGQNMIASMVLGADGGYMQSGKRSIVTIQPNQQFNASMVAYCAEFEKENPTAAETFVVTRTPERLTPVINAVNAYARVNPNANVTAAAQVAIWMAQGKTSDEIAAKFEFTPADEQLAYEFLQ